MDFRKFEITLFFCLAAAFPAQASPSVQDLERRLKSPVQLERHEAAEKLTRIGGGEARRIFGRMAGSEGAESKRIGLAGLARVAPEKNGAVFAAALADAEWEVRWAAVYGLGWTGDPAWIPELKRVAENDPRFSKQQQRHPVREEAKLAIRRIEESPQWRPSLKAALAETAAGKKELLVFWYLPGAPWNQKMLDEAFVHPGMRELKGRYVWARADAAEERELADRFGVKEVPVWLLLGGAGEERDRWTGYYAAGALVAEWKEIARGKPTADRLAAHIRKNPRDLAAMLELARRHARNNRPHLAVPLWEKVAESKRAAGGRERAEALFALGHFYGSTGAHARAARLLERYCEEYPAEPLEPKARYCLALSLLATGKNQKSEKILRRLQNQQLDSGLEAAVREALAEIGRNRGKRGLR